MVSRFVRKVRTASGAVAVQVVTRRGGQLERVEHLGGVFTVSNREPRGVRLLAEIPLTASVAA